MAPRAFLLLTLAFAVVLLITSEVAAATELAENTDSEYKPGGHGEHIVGGRMGGHNKGGMRKDDPIYGGKGCRHGCCSSKYSKVKGGCKCCKTFAEAAAYKQTQN
ncbi:hypothetical protein Lser_V15G34839 [Lactuca serriola]